MERNVHRQKPEDDFVTHNKLKEQMQTSSQEQFRSAIPKGRHSEKSAILKAVIHGRCMEYFLILPQPDDWPQGC